MTPGIVIRKSVPDGTALRPEMKITFGVMFLILCISGTAAGQQKEQLSSAEVLEKVQLRYEHLGDASARFTQDVSFKYAKIEQSFSGTLSMKKGNKYRIESQQQTIVTDGKTVWLYTPANHQVLIDSYQHNGQTFSPDKFLLGLPKNFSADILSSDASVENTRYILKLVPKGNTGVRAIKSLKVWINDVDWSIRKVEYIDMNDTRTIYLLSSLQFNKGIDDSVFQFNPSQGTEVVDLRTVPSPSLRKQ